MQKTDPRRIFITKDRIGWFWFLMFMLTVVWSGWDRNQLVARLKARDNITILDSNGTVYRSPIFDFESATDLHASQSKFAALAFLQRNPEGLDNAQLLEQLYLPEALEKAKDQIGKELAEFKTKSLHQKVEIGEIKVLRTRQNAVLTSVDGQLIRTGVFNGGGITDNVKFSLQFMMERNPNLVTSGRFPMVVTDFKYIIK